jgi:iron uptake system EfeUOB component EfeO/EfeM
VKVTVDNSETLAAAERAESLFRELPRIMKSAVELAAATELQRKTYQDRTGLLRRRTQGRVERRGGDIHAFFEMDTEYASYVNKLGFSAFNSVGLSARDAIQDAIDALGRRITDG